MRQEAVDDPEIATRIAQYEMAFKMQTSVPELMDLVEGAEARLEMYGTSGRGRLVRRQLPAGAAAGRAGRALHPALPPRLGHHGGLKRDMPVMAKEVDQACAALIKDLKQRGMLDDTLVLWGGEFGRTPMAQGDGRDHHIKGFSMWLAGGGIKPRHHATARPTSSATTPSRTWSTSTTCTPRCSTCWASTTSGSPSASRAATSA